MDRPNVLFIITDQHRADCLGCYGNDRIRTPNIDRIAEEGVRADRAYVTNPLCTPSRATILTGRSVSGHGAWNLGVALPESIPTLPGYLSEREYRTGAIGKIDLTPQAPGYPEFPENADFWNRDPEPDWHGPYFGFDEVDLFVGHGNLIGHYGQYIRNQHPELVDRYDRKYALEEPTGAPSSWKSGVPVEHHSSTWIGDRTQEFLRAHDGRPFFAQCSFLLPHFAFAPPAPYCYQYEYEDMPLPEQQNGDLVGKPPHVLGYARSKSEGVRLCDVPDIHRRETIAHTYGMISLLDDVIGRILKTLEETGLAENTIVMFCSDHGELLWDHGLLKKGPYPYEGLLRTPMIWRWPAGLPQGRAADGVFSFADIAPTTLGLLEMDPWESIEGCSQVPVLRGDTGSVREAALTEYYHGRERPEDGMRLKTLTTDRWRLTHYVGEPFGELYDLQRDPGEFKNLYDRADHREIRARLTERLLDELAGSDARFGPRLTNT